MISFFRELLSFCVGYKIKSKLHSSVVQASLLWTPFTHILGNLNYISSLCILHPHFMHLTSHCPLCTSYAFFPPLPLHIVASPYSTFFQFLFSQAGYVWILSSLNIFSTKLLLFFHPPKLLVISLLWISIIFHLYHSCKEHCISHWEYKGE